MASIDAWTCPTCKTAITSPFCAQCGERRVAPRELTLRAVAERILHALTSVDGRVMRSFWRLLRHPGTLTVAYVDGVRKPWTSPVALFLLANLLFFTVQSATGTNIFGSSLESHLHQQDWSDFAQTLLARHLQRTQSSLASYAPLFDRANVLHAKSLVILMVLPFALLLPLAFHRAGRPFMAHLAFSLHLYAFLLLLFSLAVLVAAVHAALGGAGLESPRVDNWLSVLNLGACAAYLFAASAPVYGGSRPARAAKAVLLACAAAAIVLGYRFVLLPITLYFS